MARNKQFKGCLQRFIYDRLRGQRHLAIPFRTSYWIICASVAVSLGNVKGRGDCERNYTVNYLKKIEMPWRLPKKKKTATKDDVRR